MDVPSIKLFGATNVKNLFFLIAIFSVDLTIVKLDTSYFLESHASIHQVDLIWLDPWLIRISLLFISFIYEFISL